MSPAIARAAASGAGLPPPGLTDAAVRASRAAHGRNVLAADARSGLLATLREVVADPMFVLLLVTGTIYFWMGHLEDALALGVALLLVAGISVYQSVRSDRALRALRELTQPRVQVRRNGRLGAVPVEDLVVGDAVQVAEGGRVPADGRLDAASDFTLDEAILTGEAVAVTKGPGDLVFAGTSTASGSAWLTVTAVGGQTELGRIGQRLATIETEKTPLQRQVGQFVARMTWVGVAAFLLVWGINFARSGNWATALLLALTLAMSLLPQELPVAFSGFMALGAARLSRLGVLTKQPQTVESLGSATVICADKTGTLTQEGMSVRQLYDGASATLGIIVCDRAGDIVSANQLAGQLFGYPADELLGQRIEALVPDATGRHHEQLRASFNARPQVRGMGTHRVLRGQRQDGSAFPVDVNLSYFHLDEQLYVVAYVFDLTLKKAAEQELIDQHQRVARLNADLEQKVADRTHALLTTLEQLEKRRRELALALVAERELGELKSRFVSMASHEFRTPLTAVLTSAELIGDYAEGHQQDKRLKHVQRIRASVKHLNDILEEFLSVSRIEEGKIEAQPANCDLAALLADTLADVQSLRKTGQRVEQRVECPHSLRLDGSLLRKIVVNLLSNALKYSGEGTVVSVRAECHRHQLRLSVADQGVGISPEEQAHLFERFFRARSVSTVPGTGLGLYIIARYLELMGGTIALTSELNVGTTVTISIPYENHSAD